MFRGLFGTTSGDLGPASSMKRRPRWALAAPVLALSTSIAYVLPAAGTQAGAASPRVVAGPTNIRLEPLSGLHGPMRATEGSIPINTSPNWSGYIALKASGHATGFTYVASHFTVPAVNCNATPNTFSYHWVGIDGVAPLSSTVEQTGVASECNGYTPTYFAWWEMYPAPLNIVFAVNPGDEVTARVAYLGGGKYSLALIDYTQGNNSIVTEACASGCKNSTAEVITEGYANPPGALGTSAFVEEHYGMIVLTGQNSNGSHTTGGLIDSDWAVAGVEAVGQSGGVDDEPLPLASAPATGSYPAESAFTNSFQREN